MQEDPLAALKADNHNDMDIELEGKTYLQEDHDQFGCNTLLKADYPHEY